MQRLNYDFYKRSNVVQVAKDLLGKLLVTTFNGVHTAGRIVETEAYAGVTDRASHAYGGRHTARNAVMYGPGGVSYVYLCYGIHHLFNVVTNEPGVPHAVLVRSITPVIGIDVMLQRSGKKAGDRTLGKGPGNVTKALGIHTRHTGTSLLNGEIFIASDGCAVKKSEVLATPRIGIDYAGEDALLPYRFLYQANGR